MNAAAENYIVKQVPSHPGRWEVHCETAAGSVFTEAFDGPDAETDARELAAYLNAGGA